MPDAMPDDVALVRSVEETARKVFEQAGFEEIRTPLFEDTRLFVRGIGEATDIVEKEMYTFAGGDGEESLTLRPEGTASVARAVVEHDLLKKRAFWKLYYMGPMFRKERPQAGRLRQFDQIGCEAVGSSEPLVDAECIVLAHRFFRSVGLDDVRVKLNSMGCATCRGEYRKALRAALEPRRPALCPDCQARFERNVFRVLDCKQTRCREVAQAAPPLRDYLDAECRAHFEAVLGLLGDVGLPFVLDDKLVRGFDYYTRTVFEISHPALGARDAVCGGGRYDNLIAELGGPQAGCVGFAVGVVPTLLALKRTQRGSAAPARRLAAFVVAVGEEQRRECFRAVVRLRDAGFPADLDCEGRSLKAQMRAADRSGARFTLVIGPDEMAANRIRLKDMRSGEESVLSFDQVVEMLDKAGARNPGVC